jgi:hypothetical protein
MKQLATQREALLPAAPVGPSDTEIARRAAPPLW